jgi:hypothetical protein
LQEFEIPDSTLSVLRRKKPVAVRFQPAVSRDDKGNVVDPKLNLSVNKLIRRMVGMSVARSIQ